MQAFRSQCDKHSMEETALLCACQTLDINIGLRWAHLSTL